MGIAERSQEPGGKPIEETEARRPIRLAVIVAVIAALLLSSFLLVFFVIMPQLAPDRTAPNVDTSANWTGAGYDVRITTDREEPIDRFQVYMLKDGSFWLSSPTPLSEGNILVGPLDEYLNFTDLTGDGRLSNGDFFTLENLSSGSQYELVLYWAPNHTALAAELVSVP